MKIVWIKLNFTNEIVICMVNTTASIAWQYIKKFLDSILSVVHRSQNWWSLYSSLTLHSLLPWPRLIVASQSWPILPLWPLHPISQTVSIDFSPRWLLKITNACDYSLEPFRWPLPEHNSLNALTLTTCPFLLVGIVKSCSNARIIHIMLLITG